MSISLAALELLAGLAKVRRPPVDTPGITQGSGCLCCAKLCLYKGRVYVMYTEEDYGHLWHFF